MLRRETLRSFIVRLILIYVILAIPLPGVYRGYGKAFLACANALFSANALARNVWFEAPAAPAADWDTWMVMRDARTSDTSRMEFSSRAWSYLPTAAVIALTLAVPPPWPRRWRALVISLVLVHIFIVLRIWAAVLYGFHYGGIIELGKFWGKAAEVLLLSFSGSPVTTYVVPIIIWLLVAVGRSDWEAMFRGKNPDELPCSESNATIQQSSRLKSGPRHDST